MQEAVTRSIPRTRAGTIQSCRGGRLWLQVHYIVHPGHVGNR